MSEHRNWTREELILAINLYCRTPFGKIHNRNPEVIKLAAAINRTASAISYKLANFASIDPSLPRKGASNFSKLDQEVWNEFFNDWEKLAYESERLREKLDKTYLVNRNEREFPEGKVKEGIVKLRINQAFFRQTILATYNFKCCITAISIPELLVASHIVPWAKDEKHRMNPCNGLCLNALHDRAFDLGMITLSNDYRIIISSYLENKCTYESERNYFLKFKNQRIALPDRFLPDKKFLAYHRENIFKQKTRLSVESENTVS